MAGVHITFGQLTLGELRTRLNRLDSDLSSAMIEISEALLQNTQERAAKEIAPDGTPWAPLAASTQRQKARQALSINKTLHGESGNLFGTLFPFASVLEAGVSTGPGTRKYAAVHQFGHRFGAKRQVPARPYLGISRDDEAEVVDILRQYLFSTPI